MTERNENFVKGLRLLNDYETVDDVPDDLLFEIRCLMDSAYIYYEFDELRKNVKDFQERNPDEWRAIRGFSGYYINKRGDVLCKTYKDEYGRVHYWHLRPKTTKENNKRVALMNKRTRTVTNLMASIWLGCTETEAKTAYVINGNEQDLRIENIGIKKRGKKHGRID